MFVFVFATIGSAALYLLFVWLLSAAGAAWLAARKGYTERVGLMFGLVLSAVGFLIVLLLPARPGSVWKVEGPLPNPGARRPLGIPALGPVASTDVAGPALADRPDAGAAPDADAGAAPDADAGAPPPEDDGPHPG